MLLACVAISFAQVSGYLEEAGGQFREAIRPAASTQRASNSDLESYLQERVHTQSQAHTLMNGKKKTFQF